MSPATCSAAPRASFLKGHLDAFFAYWFEQPPFSSPYGQHPELLRGIGGGEFVHAIHESGIELRRSMTAEPATGVVTDVMESSSLSASLSLSRTGIRTLVSKGVVAESPSAMGSSLGSGSESMVSVSGVLSTVPSLTMSCTRYEPATSGSRVGVGESGFVVAAEGYIT